MQLNDSTVQMSMDLGNGAKVGIRYTLPKDSYLVKVEVLQENMDKIIPSNITDMGFNWYQMMSRHEEGEVFEERNSGIFYKFAGGSVENLSETSADSQKLI